MRVNAAIPNLRDADGYYCDIIEFADGKKIKIRDVGDDVLQQHDALAQEVQRLREQNPNDLSILSRLREMIDMICVAGVVSWEGIADECSPENIRRLPPNAKTILYQNILKHSILSYTEEDFLAGSPKK